MLNLFKKKKEIELNPSQKLKDLLKIQKELTEEDLKKLLAGPSFLPFTLETMRNIQADFKMFPVNSVKELCFYERYEVAGKMRALVVFIGDDGFMVQGAIKLDASSGVQNSSLECLSRESVIELMKNFLSDKRINI